VGTGLNAVGYSGIGYKTSNVRTVPLAKKDGGEFVDATEANALKGTYPLARVLYVYVNKAPNKALSPMELEFVKMVLSKQGQDVVVKDGYIPLPAALAQKELAKVQ
jgi:phosphate transport system substrate-binding protein